MYNQALRIHPGLAEAWNNKGYSLSKLYRYEEAIQCYDKALEINPRDAPAWNNKGLILSEIGEDELAIQCYDKALEINPRLAPSWYGKGQSMEKLERYEDAIKSFERAGLIDPTYSIMRSLEETPFGQIGKKIRSGSSSVLSKIIDPNIVSQTRKRMDSSFKLKRTSEFEAKLGGIQIKNLKSLQDTKMLNLKPITLLFGPNSYKNSFYTHLIIVHLICVNENRTKGKQIHS